MKSWVGLVGWPTADVWPTKWSSVQLAVRRRTRKVRRPKTSVLPLCYAANFSFLDQDHNEIIIIFIIFKCPSALQRLKWWLVSTTGVHGPSSRAELTARELGCIFWHPSTRAVNSGSGNRPWHCRKEMVLCSPLQGIVIAYKKVMSQVWSCSCRRFHVRSSRWIAAFSALVWTPDYCSKMCSLLFECADVLFILLIKTKGQNRPLKCQWK